MDVTNDTDPLKNIFPKRVSLKESFFQYSF